MYVVDFKKGVPGMADFDGNWALQQVHIVTLYLGIH